MRIFFDTETTGLPKNWREPPENSSNWPHIVQIAWAQYDDAGAQTSFKSYIIQPEGFVIPPAAFRVHGISTERAIREGALLLDVLGEFKTAVEGSKLLIAHNMDFDEKMVRAELSRKRMPDFLQGIGKLCTMKRTADFCAIPGPYGNKWPTLAELHRKLFDSDFEKQHDAGADVLCCAKCYFELERRSFFREPLKSVKVRC